MVGLTPRIHSAAEQGRKRLCTHCGEDKVWAEFPHRTLWPDGTIRTVQSICRGCKVGLDLDWQRRNEDRVRAYKAAWHRRHRAAMRAERDRNGRAGQLIPVEPLRSFLVAQLPDRNIEEMAIAADVNERVIRRLMNEATCVGLVQADRLITRLGGVLEMVYPYEEAA